jgi:hypothetical protein
LVQGYVGGGITRDDLRYGSKEVGGGILVGKNTYRAAAGGFSLSVGDKQLYVRGGQIMGKALVDELLKQQLLTKVVQQGKNALVSPLSAGDAFNNPPPRQSGSFGELKMRELEAREGTYTLGVGKGKVGPPRLPHYGSLGSLIMQDLDAKERQQKLLQEGQEIDRFTTSLETSGGKNVLTGVHLERALKTSQNLQQVSSFGLLAGLMLPGQTGQAIGTTSFAMGAGGALHSSLFGGHSAKLMTQRSLIEEQLNEVQKDTNITEEKRIETLGKLNKDLDTVNNKISNFAKLSRGVGAGLLVGTAAYGILSAIGSNYRAGSLELAGRGNLKDYRRSLQEGTTANRISNAGIGAGIGAVVGGVAGSFLMPVGGTYGGAMIGAALGGGIGSMFGGNTDKQRAVYLNKVTDNVTSALTDLARNISRGNVTVEQSLGDISSVIDQTVSLMDQANGDMRGEVLSQISQQGTNINTILSEMAKSANSMQEFNDKFGIASTKLINTLSQITGQSTDKIRKNLEEQNKAYLNQSHLNDLFVVQARKMTELSTSLSNISVAFNTAFDSTTDYVSGLEDRFSGRQYNIRGPSGISNLFNNPANTSGTKLLETTLDGIIKGLGDSGKTLKDTAVYAAKAEQDLPRMLSTAAAQSTLDAQSFITNLNGGGQLQKAFGDELGTFLNDALQGMAAGGLGKSPGELIQKLIDNPQEIVGQLLKDSQGTRALKLLDDVYKKRIELENKVLDLYQRHADLLEKVQNKEIQAREIGTERIISRGNFNENPQMGWTAQLAMGQFRQQKLAGGLANNPQGIVNAILEGQRRVAQYGIDINKNVNDEQEVSRLIKLKTSEEAKIKNYIAALEDLQSSTLQLKVAQEKLNKATNDRQTKNQFLSDFVFGNPEGRFGIARTYAGVQQSVKQGNLAGIPPNLRESIAAFFERFADTELQVLGGRTGRQAKQYVMAGEAKRYGIPLGEAQQINKSPAELAAQAQLENIYNKMQEAALVAAGLYKKSGEDLISGWGGENKKLIGGLQNVFDNFNKELQQTLNTAQIADVQNQIDNALNKKSQVLGVGGAFNKAQSALGLPAFTSDKEVSSRLNQVLEAQPNIYKLRRMNKNLVETAGIINSYDPGLGITKHESSFGVGYTASRSNILDKIKATQEYKDTGKITKNDVKNMVGELGIKNYDKLGLDTQATLENIVRDIIPKSNSMVNFNQEFFKELQKYFSEQKIKQADVKTELGKSPLDKKTINELLNKGSEDFDTFIKDLKDYQTTIKSNMDLWQKYSGGIAESLKNIQTTLDELDIRKNQLTTPVEAPKKASGGMVGGVGNSDNQLIMATPGEYILKKSAVNKLGVPFLNQLNRYANGGMIGKRRITEDELEAMEIRNKQIVERNNFYRSQKKLEETKKLQQRMAENQQRVQIDKERMDMNNFHLSQGLSDRLLSRESSTSTKVKTLPSTNRTYSDVLNQRKQDYQEEMKRRRDLYVQGQSDKFYAYQESHGGRNARLPQPQQNIQPGMMGGQPRIIGGGGQPQVALPGGVGNNLDKFLAGLNQWTVNVGKLKLPTEITLTGTHKVEVIINGADVLQSMSEPIKGIVTAEITKALAKYSDQLNNGKTPANAQAGPLGGQPIQDKG